ncbi:MAG: AMP-binding protein [Bacteroidales bacterium]|nr:AMP-binding protein [Bacteroidales bacterium]
MAKEKQILRLNFNAFDNDWMQQYAHGHLGENVSPADWKKNLMYFLLDWLSDSETITAQTSGSTGDPKKIELEKTYMEASARMTLDFFGLNDGDTALLCLPINYIASKMMVVRGVVGKLDLFCIPPSLNPVSYWTPQIDFAAMTPAQLSQLLKTEEGTEFLKTIKILLLGGSIIPDALEEKTRNLSTEIWHSYAMTETKSHIALRKVNGPGRSQYFTTLPGVQIKKDEEQCLNITAPHLGVFELKTNDLVQITDEGFQILGRKDNIINSGGVKLFPETIEKKLSPFIEDAFFMGSVPDEQLGEKLVLFIESDDETRRSQLEEIIHRELTGFDIPKEIIFKAAFLRTESGKIIRK